MKAINATYEVKVLDFLEIQELPGSWTNQEFREILEATDVEGWEEIEEADLREYAIMALQDLEPDEAAEIVLHQKLGSTLKKGQIENMSHEMLDEKLWEEYTDINLHKDLYNCGVLLRWAFPRKFPETDAIKCSISLKSDRIGAVDEISKSFLTRLLARGMDKHAVINRLFEDQVNGKPFIEAEGIIWQFEVSKELEKTLITVFSSNYWLHPMDTVDHYHTKITS